MKDAVAASTAHQYRQSGWMAAAPGAFIPGAVTRTGLERTNPVHGADGQPSGYRMRDLANRPTKERLRPSRRYLRNHLPQGPCQRFARNCATHSLTSPRYPTLGSTFHLLDCVGR
jgi:hypothetical protein